MLQGIFIPIAMPEADNEFVSVTIFPTGNATVRWILNGKPKGNPETVFVSEFNIGTQEEMA